MILLVSNLLLLYFCKVCLLSHPNPKIPTDIPRADPKSKRVSSKENIVAGIPKEIQSRRRKSVVSTIRIQLLIFQSPDVFGIRDDFCALHLRPAPQKIVFCKPEYLHEIGRQIAIRNRLLCWTAKL